MEASKLKKLQEMEEAYAAFLPHLEAFSRELEQFQEAYQEYAQLREYYGSEDWWSLSEKLSEDYKCGVLSQDRLYNLIQDHDELIADLLELSHRMYRNR
ncbi:DUF4298 domain-containing protein [Streptococcus sp. 10F2]